MRYFSSFLFLFSIMRLSSSVGYFSISKSFTSTSFSSTLTTPASTFPITFSTTDSACRQAAPSPFFLPASISSLRYYLFNYQIVINQFYECSPLILLQLTSGLNTMKNILCIGGSGQLGSRVVSILSQYNVVNVDLKPHQLAKKNIIVQREKKVEENNRAVVESVRGLGIKYNAILVTAGGWTGGSIKDADYIEKVRLMNEVNLYPSLLAAHLATKFLNPNGIVVFTGAAAVYKEPQADMIAYALAKAGVHYLATNLAEKAENKDYLDGKIITILPETIDTQTNREAMPTSDFSKWAKPQQIGELLKSWVEGLNVPSNGSFVLLKVKNSCIQPQFL